MRNIKNQSFGKEGLGLSAEIKDQSFGEENSSPSPIGVQRRKPRGVVTLPGRFLKNHGARLRRPRESLVKALEPIAVEARDKIRDVTSVLDEAAGKSSVEVRSFVAKTLESMAEKIKPK